MPLTLGSNISSLRAQRRLADGTTQISSTFQKLSSGLRINRASDDAAGLSISESLKSDRRIFNQGVRNFNDGLSLLTIADGALESLSNIVVRLKELAEQSSNGSYSNTQREALNKEAQSLSKEYTRIIQSTKFNGVSLLNGSLGSGVRLQGGYGTDGSIFSGVGGATGTGTFSGNTTIASTSAEVLLGDINGDGHVDLVKAAGTGITVNLGNSTGSFGTTSTISMGINSGDLALSDVNNDGIADILTSGNQGGIGSVSVRLGLGSGAFAGAKTFTTPAASLADVAVSDLNGDQFLDVVAVGGSNRAYVFMGAGDGNFASPVSYVMNDTSDGVLKIADMNSDGIDDLISGGVSSGFGSVVVRLGVGNGTFGTGVSYTMEDSVTADMDVADLNNDGKLDVVSVGENNKISVRLGSINGQLGNVTNYNIGSVDPYTVAIGDLNGDGLLDLSVGGYDTTDSVNSFIIKLGIGDGSFGQSATINTVFGISTSDLGDINADGVLDLVSNIYIFTGAVREGSAPLLPFDLSSAFEAREALPQFDQKIQQLSKQRGQIGAFMSRLNVGINVLQASSEMYATAESRISSTDVAEESSKLTRLSILQRASSAVLAQANMQPELALSLLGSGKT